MKLTDYMYHDKDWGRGIAIIEDSVVTSIQLEDNIEKHEEGQITAIRKEHYE